MRAGGSCGSSARSAAEKRRVARTWSRREDAHLRAPGARPSVCSRLSESRERLASRSGSRSRAPAFFAPPGGSARRSRGPSRKSKPRRRSTTTAPRRTSQLTETKPDSALAVAFTTQTAPTRAPTDSALAGSAPPPSTRRFSSLPFLGDSAARMRVATAHHRARAPDDRALGDVAIDTRRRPRVVASLRTRHRRRRRGAPTSPLVGAAAATSTYRAMSSWSARLDRWRHPPSSSKPARSAFGGFAFRRGFRSPRGFRRFRRFFAFSPSSPERARFSVGPAPSPSPRVVAQTRLVAFGSDVHGRSTRDIAADARARPRSARRRREPRAIAPKALDVVRPSSVSPDARFPRAPARTTSSAAGRDRIRGVASAPAHTAPARSVRVGRNARAPRATHPTGAPRVTRVGRSRRRLGENNDPVSRPGPTPTPAGCSRAATARARRRSSTRDVSSRSAARRAGPMSQTASHTSTRRNPFLPSPPYLPPSAVSARVRVRRENDVDDSRRAEHSWYSLQAHTRRTFSSVAFTSFDAPR